MVVRKIRVFVQGPFKENIGCGFLWSKGLLRMYEFLFPSRNHSVKQSGGILRLDNIKYYFTQTTMGFSSLKDSNDSWMALKRDSTNHAE